MRSLRACKFELLGDKQSVRPGFSATRLVVRTEAQQVAALKGKPVSISSKAVSVAMVLPNHLAGFGMTHADVHVVELPYPGMVSDGEAEVHAIDVMPDAQAT